MSGQTVFSITKIGDKEHSDITFGGAELNQLASSTGQIAGAWGWGMDPLPKLSLSKVSQQPTIPSGVSGVLAPFITFIRT